MALDEEREELAAEYVLGTLSHGEREETDRLIASDPAFASLVSAWEHRLVPLARATAPVAPPPDVRRAILARISGGGQSSGNVVSLRRQVSLWRSGSVALAALAAVLAGFIFIGPRQAGEPARYVAVLQSEGPGPAFVASIDLASGTIAVRRVGAEPQPGKSYELWAVGGGREKPQSLGVIDASLKVPASKYGNLAPETVLAISLEPEGGSPTGQPTGPVLFTGKLVATE